MAKRQTEYFSRPVRFVRSVLEWIGKHEFSVMVAFLLLVASILGFIKLADNVMEGKTARFDEWAVKAMRHADDLTKPIGPGWLTELGRDITALGGVTVLTLLTATIAGFLWLRRMYGAMLLVLVGTLGAQAASTLLKFAFGRPRPQLVPHLSLTYTSSFPSGHAMLSAAVYLTLGALLGRFVKDRLLKAYFLIVAATLTVSVGASRVYMGVHYPSDVIAGWAAGLAWAIACWIIARNMQHHNIVETDVSQSGGNELGIRTPEMAPTETIK